MTLNKANLSEAVRDIVLQRIAEGTFQAGSRVVESRLARELGVSQAPVREALRELTSLGVIDIVPNRGAVVSEVPEEELRAVIPVRAVLEETAAREAAKVSTGVVTSLQVQIDGMREAADAMDIRAHVEHSAMFHRAVVEASGNRVLIAIWRTVAFRALTMVTHLSNAIDMHANALSHQPIADAIAEGDVELAGQLMRDHVDEYADLHQDCVMRHHG